MKHLALAVAALSFAPAAARPNVRERKLDPLHAAALEWLAKHQDDDGRWDCDGFGKHDPEDDRCGGPGREWYDLGVSSLATLAFLKAGYTDRKEPDENPYAGTVERGLAWIRSRQKKSGCFLHRDTSAWMYEHAMATFAFTEAAARTGDEQHKAAAARGAAFLVKARKPDGGWRYEPGAGTSCTSVTTWAVLALDAARRAGCEVGADAFASALRFVELMTDAETGRCGYYERGKPMAIEGYSAERVRTSTAGGVLVRLLAGENPRLSPVIKKGTERVLEVPPGAKTERNLYYWYFGTASLKAHGRAPWRKWKRPLKKSLSGLVHRRGSGARTGSIDPLTSWGPRGGRVMTTALASLCFAELR